MRTTHRVILSGLFAVTGVFILAGCGESDTFEEAGEEIDESVEEAGDTLEEAGDELEDMTDTDSGKGG